MAIFLESKSTGPDDYNSLVPVLDAGKLYADCIAAGLDTSWWFSLANQITLVAGEQPSTAYLLLTKRQLVGDDPADPTFDYGSFAHKLWLVDQFRYTSTTSLDTEGTETAVPAANAPFQVGLWAFHSARAIDGSLSEHDLDTAYLVKFCDFRAFVDGPRGFNMNDGGAVLSITHAGVSSTPAASGGYNIVSQSRSETGMSYDVMDTAQFPYELATTDQDNEAPWEWEDVLLFLWRSATWNIFETSSLPEGGDYPVANPPIDIRLEDRPTWKVFCDLLHSSGNELYPKLDGTYQILPIDRYYLQSFSYLDHYRNFLVEVGHPVDPARRMATHWNMYFQRRNAHIDLVNENGFYSYSDYGSALDLNALVEDHAFNGSYPHTAFLDDEDAIGLVHSIPSFAMTAVYPKGSAVDASPVNQGQINSFVEEILPRYIRALLSQKADHTYGKFIDFAPHPEFNEVTWYLGPGGPTTRFRSKLTYIGQDDLPEIPGGSGSGGDDRHVAANDADDTPATLIEKINDTGVTYTPGTHQLVYGNIVETAGPPTNHHVRLFTTTVTGTPGDPGPPGADGDTVAEGYAIDLEGAGNVTIHNDPTEWTAFNKDVWQFFIHIPIPGAAARTDPAWQTGANYLPGKDQFLWHRSSTWRFESAEGYDTTKDQFLWHQDGVWTWQTYEGYDGGARQMVFQDQSTWRLKTTTGYLPGAIQLLVNVNNAWEWFTVGQHVVHRIDDIAFELVGTKLRITVTRTPVTVFGVLGVQDQVVREVDTTECTEP